MLHSCCWPATWTPLQSRLHTLATVPTESLYCMATVCAALTLKVLCRLM